MGLIALFKVKKTIEAALTADPSLKDKITVKYGEVVTDKEEVILFDGDALAENMPVFTVSENAPDPVPVPNGTYVLKTGETIEVKDGICVKITASAAPADASTATTPPAAKTEQATPKQVVERHEIESYFNETIKPQIDALTQKVTDLTAANTQLTEANKKLDADLNTEKEKVTKMGSQLSAKPASTTLQMGSEKVELSMAEKLAKLNQAHK